MAKLTLNGIPKNGGFLLSNKGPLDVRTVVTEYTHLAELVTGNKAYVGMVVYVNSTGEDKGLYVCKSINGSGTWELVGATSDAYTKDEVDAKLEVLTNALNAYIEDIDELIGDGNISGGA